MSGRAAVGLLTALLLGCGGSSGGVDPDAGDDTLDTDLADTMPDTVDLTDTALDTHPTVLIAGIAAVSPSAASARGGDVVAILGAGFTEPLEVEFNGISAAVLAVTDAQITAVVPRLVAGPADVTVFLSKQTLTLADGLTVLPLARRFATATQDTVEAPGGQVVYDAVALDVDADGDPDVVVATDVGLRVLANTGGALRLLTRVDASGEPVPLSPGGVTTPRALAVADLGDGAGDALIVCDDGDTDFILRPTPAGLATGPSMPTRPGRCVATAAQDLDGDGQDSVALLVRDGDEVGLWLVRHSNAGDGAAGRLVYDAEVTSLPAQPSPIGTITGGDPRVEQTLERTRDPDAGLAVRATAALTAHGQEIEFSLPLPSATVPTINVRARREGGGSDAVGAHLAVIDANGARFDGPPLSLTGVWATVGPFDASTWAPADTDAGDSSPSAPIQSLSLVVTAAPGFFPADPPPPAEGDPLGLVLTGGFWLDDIRYTGTDGEVDVERFDVFEVRWSQPGARRILGAELDGDGRGDWLILGASTPTLLTTQRAPTSEGAFPWHSHELTTAPSGASFAAVTALDAGGDGRTDLAFVAPTQDRLLVGDGWGRFVDATLGGFPVDASDGRAVAAADLDLDGVDDLVVGNHGVSDRVYFGRPDARYVDGTPNFGFDDANTAVILVVDLDGDGDSDVVSLNADGALAPTVRFMVTP